MPITRLGVLSDTHGLLRPEALEQLTGSELILHAGDVGDLDIITRLKTLAPTVAIRGNIDRSAPVNLLPQTEFVDAGDFSIYMLHDVGDLDLNPAAAQIDMVVSGHSHKPDWHMKSGVLYLNPGSAGPRRFHLPVTLARLDLSRRPPRVEFIDLLSGVPLDIANRSSAQSD